MFFGYYEIDVLKREWGRPFGYEDDGRTVRFEDVVRIGKADWNYFSNHLYGVPEEAIRPFNAIDMSTTQTQNLGRQKVGPAFWDMIRVANVSVVGPYVSRHDGQSLINVDFPPIVSTAWRFAFGTYPDDDAGPPTSFAGTTMSGEFYMSYMEDQVEGEEVYETYLFGGTVNEGFPDKAENRRFLDLQLASVRNVIAQQEGLGFSS